MMTRVRRSRPPTRRPSPHNKTEGSPPDAYTTQMDLTINRCEIDRGPPDDLRKERGHRQTCTKFGGEHDRRTPTNGIERDAPGVSVRELIRQQAQTRGCAHFNED